MKTESVAKLRQVIATDAQLTSRIGTMVRTARGGSVRQLEVLIQLRILEPLVVRLGSYAFDDQTFTSVYLPIERDLLADTSTYVTYVPLLGFDASIADLALPGPFFVRRMTDDELAFAIGTASVPTSPTLGPGWVRVSRFSQWAATAEMSLPILSENEDEPPPASPPVQEAADRFVEALRLAVGGSVVATRQLDKERPTSISEGGSGGAHLRPYAPADEDRPCVLHAGDVQEVVSLFEALHRDSVRSDCHISIAVRRLTQAGARLDPEDRLVDLTVAAEALFTQAESKTEVGFRMAIRAALLTALNPGAEHDAPDVLEFMRRTYDLRSTLLHGTTYSPKKLRRIDRTQAATLSEVADDFDRVMRQSLSFIILSRSSSQPPIDQWNIRLDDALRVVQEHSRAKRDG